MMMLRKIFKPINMWRATLLAPRPAAAATALLLVAAAVPGAALQHAPAGSKAPAGRATPPAAQPATAPLPPLNARLLEFCRARLGQQVGDGECSSLVDEGLRVIGAARRQREDPGPGDYVWGALLCVLESKNGAASLQVTDAGKSADKRRRADVRPGDIIQFRDTEFRGRIPHGTYWFDLPHHTAVVEQVSEDGRDCKLLHQNVDNKRYVVETTLHLPDLVRGWLRVYRPAPSGS